MQPEFTSHAGSSQTITLPPPSTFPSPTFPLSQGHAFIRDTWALGYVTECNWTGGSWLFEGKVGVDIVKLEEDRIEWENMLSEVDGTIDYQG